MNRIPLGRAYAIASQISREIRRYGVPLERVSPIGGIRRFTPDVSGVALLGVAPRAQHEPVLTAVAALPAASSVASKTDSAISIVTDRGVVTLRVAAPEYAGAALVWHTGSRAHVELLASRAAQLGMSFADGILHKGAAVIEAATEVDVYRVLDLPLIVPELRHGGDEVEAAIQGRLPALIDDLHIRGDLHMHTTWSDGRDSISDMVGVARQLGYEYVAITDHSQRSMASRRLLLNDIAQQREELEDVRRRMAGIEVLHGVEVDIMPDGSLDFDDEVLAGFDIVLASLHDHAGQSGADLTTRCLAAIRHPLVNVITHPANRTPGHFDGYDMDYERLFEAAAQTGTALEIDGAPGHLDMDGALSRRAVAAGATLTIDSDAHRAEWLGRQMRFGVGTARRGWVGPEHVLNTRGIDAVRAFIARKRNGGVEPARTAATSLPSQS